jgi:hypothetical protein
MQPHTSIRNPAAQRAYERMLLHMARRHHAAIQSFVPRRLAAVILLKLPRVLFHMAVLLAIGFLMALVSAMTVVFFYR